MLTVLVQKQQSEDFSGITREPEGKKNSPDDSREQPEAITTKSKSIAALVMEERKKQAQK